MRYYALFWSLSCCMSPNMVQMTEANAFNVKLWACAIQTQQLIIQFNFQMFYLQRKLYWSIPTNTTDQSVRAVHLEIAWRWYDDMTAFLNEFAVPQSKLYNFVPRTTDRNFSRLDETINRSFSCDVKAAMFVQHKNFLNRSDCFGTLSRCHGEGPQLWPNNLEKLPLHNSCIWLFLTKFLLLIE